MSGYTRLTETEGDELAVRASDTIRERAQRASRAHGGSMVKILGDGAMLHFPDVATALPAVVGLVDELTGGRLPVHAGVHAGSLIEHDGDYFGRTVNIASRVTKVVGLERWWSPTKWWRPHAADSASPRCLRPI